MGEAASARAEWAAVPGLLLELQKSKVPGLEVDHQHRDQHQHAADQRVEEELDRRVLLAAGRPRCR